MKTGPWPLAGLVADPSPHDFDDIPKDIFFDCANPISPPQVNENGKMKTGRDKNERGCALVRTPDGMPLRMPVLPRGMWVAHYVPQGSSMAGPPLYSIKGGHA